MFSRVILIFFPLSFLNLISNVFSDLPNFVHDFIKSSNRLDKYSITILLEYEKNQTEHLLEEKIYFKKESFTDLKNVNLQNYELDIALCAGENPNLYNTKSFEFSILKLLQNVLKFRMKIETLDLKNEDVNNVDEKIFINKTFDLILCQPNINKSFYQPLYPIKKSSYIIIYKPDNISINQDIFVLTFAGTLWFCFVLVILLLAICLNFTTKQYSKIYGHPSWGTVDIMFWGIASACQQGLSTTPTGFASRVIFLLGYLTSYLLYTGFAAAITSLLAVQNENFILYFNDIQKMKLNIAIYGNIKKFPTKYNYLKNGRTFKTIHSFLFYINEEKSIGIIEKNVLENYFLYEEKMFEYCNFINMELESLGNPTSFLVPQNWRYRSLFNYWLLRLEQTGILNRTAEKTKLKLPTCEALSGYSSATLDHVTSANLLLLAGIGASLVFLIMECLWNGYRHRRNR